MAGWRVKGDTQRIAFGWRRSVAGVLLRRCSPGLEMEEYSRRTLGCVEVCSASLNLMGALSNSHMAMALSPALTQECLRLATVFGKPSLGRQAASYSGDHKRGVICVQGCRTAV